MVYMPPPQDLLDNDLIQNLNQRRKLLPWWIKVCIWIFLTFTAVIPIAIVFGLLGYKFQISLYGFETNNPLSIIGFILMTLFLFKGIVAYGLWTSKDWAILLGIIDAILGLLVCLFVMFIYPFIGSTQDSVSSFRLEILFLIPYLIKLLKIKDNWKLAA